MAVQVRVSGRLNPGAIPTIVQGLVAPAVQRGAGVVRDQAKENISVAGRIDTGLMRNATVAEAVVVRGDQVVARVVTATSYARYQHEGTRGPIVPRRARVLRFTPKGGRGVVFARQVRGVEGVPFLTDALRQVRSADFAR